MEYGYEVMDSAGNKTFFVEGCTYCSISTGGIHEVDCPSHRKEQVIEPFTDEELRKLVSGKAVIAHSHTFSDGHQVYDKDLLGFYKKKGYI